MMNSLLPHSTFFDTYEAREEAFRRLVNFKLARRYAGPTLFWKDFGRISRSLASTQTITAVAHMSSNPRDCLAFATPRQVLLAALMTAGKPGSEANILKTAARFGMVGQLAQPIRTLSGGETVKLALAKTMINTAICSRVANQTPSCPRM